MGRQRSEVLDCACNWQARLHAHDCSEQDRLRCAAWLDESVEHRRAFDEAAAMFSSVCLVGMESRRLRDMADLAYQQGEGEVAEGGLASVHFLNNYRAGATARAPVRGVARQPGKSVADRPVSWRLLTSAAAAIVITLGCLLALVQWEPSRPQDSPLVFAAGPEVTTLTLDDGSIVQLDIGSVLTVAYSDQQRDVHLLSGRAYFEVMSDPERPFSVHAGQGEVLAVGTAFQVSHEGSQLQVILTEGIVEVYGHFQAGERNQRLRPGQQLSFDASRPVAWTVTEVDADMVTSWRNGRHLFRDLPLAEALASINRYSTIKVRLGDPLLSGMRVSGSFVRGDSKLAVSALTAAFPVRAIEADDEIILFSEYPHQD